MEGIVDWFMDLSNSKSVGLVIFFVTFVAIIIYVYGSKKRSERLETYRDIPFLDDEDNLKASFKKGEKE
ncbi:MAG: cbb3-type cytochrome c oxidase subunit 3 [Thiotrichaceae bacterium]|nr:cbb3-type cytochrome c oxidase subunit 3 [Thiotrichaceae bacterium]